MEKWKDIKGYEGIYKINNKGVVKSLKRECNHKFGKMIRKERILKNQLDKDGYETICLRKNNKQKIFKVHRLVANAFIENKENKPQVNHIDSVRNNNYYKNLEWSTCKENIIHSHKKGNSSNKGEKNPSSYLKEDDIISIRSSKMKISCLAKKHKTSYSNIWNIINFKTWKHV